ncbi:hypothetical protein BJX63DRAFT_237697 [Aspergillus granulosus]|uniref:Structure-specific endonuclease subunit SLX4 n=1 Tax=Aspergillus granulosus TaxID=176169 RepID=A0ABR4HBN1_9EURO
MHSDLIIISSSPERNVIRTPPPLALAAVTEKGQQHPTRSASSSPISSPTELLFGDPSRSKFSLPLEQTRSTTKERITKVGKAAEENSNAAISSTTQRRKERKPRAVHQAALGDLDPADVENEDNAPPKPKSTRKKRNDGRTGGEKTKNKTIFGKVAKSRAGKPDEPSVKPADCPSTSKQTREGSAGKDAIGDLQLELALKRRLDWTPTKELNIKSATLEDNGNAEGGQSKLGSLLSGYEYHEVNTVSDRFHGLGDEGPTKRRRIELVSSNFPPPKPKSPSNDSTSGKNAKLPADSKLSKKLKARPKRLTTLTARVTASYSEFAEPTDGEILITPAKTKRKGDTSSGINVPGTIVLSPETALKALDDQDLVFGTCSQLERADSPTLLRETQIALQESEKEFVSASSSRQVQGPGLTQSTNVSRLTNPPRNLWAVAARDSEGLLKDVEVIELLDTPEAPKTINLPDEDSNQEHVGQNEAHDAGHECDMISVKAPAPEIPFNTEEPPVLISQANKPIPTSDEAKVAISKSSMPNYNGFTDIELAKKIKSNGLKAIKSRKKMIEVLEKCWAAQHGRSIPEQGVDLQNAESTASTQNAGKSRPQKAEKKPRKPRETSQNKKEQPKPISSQSTKAEGGDSTTALSKNSQPTKQPDTIQDNKANCSPINKPSQSTSVRSFIDIEEIQDSEDELLLSPSQLQIQLFGLPHGDKRELPISTIPSSPSPSRSASRNNRKGTSISTTTTTKFVTASLKDNAEETLLPELGDQITKAVRAQPRQSRDELPSSWLSWHEKILMYDPIYLEDFTAWLNTEGLGLVNEDREVDAGLVRQWCESKGICCCYKVRKKGRHF